MRQRRPPRVDLSADMLDMSSIQESFLLEGIGKIDNISLSGQSKANKRDKLTRNDFEAIGSDDNFMLHCTSPISHTSTITMDNLSPASSMSVSSVLIADDAPTLPTLPVATSNDAMIGIFQPEIQLTSPISNKGPTVFVDEDCFTYITLEETKSSESSGDDFQGNAMIGNRETKHATMHSPFRSARATTSQTPCYSIQTPYTYETIESLDVVPRTGIRTQYTFETLLSSEKENTPNRSSTTSSMTRKKQKRDDLTQSPLEGKRIYSVSPVPASNSISDSSSRRITPTRKRKTKRVDLDSFSVDEYASSPDKSADRFSIDSYASSDDGCRLGFGGATALHLARTKRDQSLFRLRSLGVGQTSFQSPVRSLASPQHSTRSEQSTIIQRKDHVAKQRRRLSQVVQSYCQSTEA